MSKRYSYFPNIRSEGAILPLELLLRLIAGDASLPGMRPEDYHLSPSERLNEAATRSFSRLTGVYSAFQSYLSRLPESQSGTTATRERWLLPLFQELGYGSLKAINGVEWEGKKYPLSHQAQEPAAFMLISCKWDLDKREPHSQFFGSHSPHSQMQEYLNRSPGQLWGFMSNGYKLRILRNNVSLTRMAYLEFDLKAIMETESYSEFFLLWLLCHQSRLEAQNDDAGRRLPPHSAWLEKWYQGSISEGVRALEELRESVKSAIEALGAGFIAHPANSSLRADLQSGKLSLNNFYNQVLRQVYRLILIFVAEDRELLLPSSGDPEKLQYYQKYYATYRIRELAAKKRGSKHIDLWLQLQLLFLSLWQGNPHLDIKPLGSFLFSPLATPDLGSCQLYNSHLLAAFRQLCYTQKNKLLQAINYRHLGPEELGSVYESLLEMHPEINIPAGSFSLDFVAGSLRKTSGSYYTHSSLVNSLLDTALEPVIDATLQRAKAENRNPAQALLSLSICDPACGSGHFLIAAAHRLAKHLAALRSGEDEPTPIAMHQALREVIGSCLYGVDINPMAVELCKISLWMEALEPGKPLTFLDHHIQCGNSLIGCTPALLDAGIPDAAFNPLVGDDPIICRKYKKLNKDENIGGVIDFFEGEYQQYQEKNALLKDYQALSQMPDAELSDIQQKELSYRGFIQSTAYQNALLACNAWCAAFVWIKDGSPQRPAPLTFGSLESIKNDPDHLPTATKAEIQRLAEEYQFFHWHLAFPDIFGEEANTGFDCVLGNPPWEHNELKEKEWFTGRDDDIAQATGNIRKLLILGLKTENPALYEEYHKSLRYYQATSAMFNKDSGLYPLCGTGRINTYTIFAELNYRLVSSRGRSGFIVPSGIATDDSTKYFFQELINTASLASLYDFENKEGLFPGVHRSFKFSLITLRAPASFAPPTDFVFFAHSILDLEDDYRHFQLSAAEIALINPNTRTCPIFRSKADAELCKYIYRRVPVLIDENDSEHGNPWDISFRQGLFNMTSDSHLFKTLNDLEANGFVLEGNHFVQGDTRYLPLYEAKMIYHYDHRFGDFNDVPSDSVSTQLPEVSVNKLTKPTFEPLPRYWMSEQIFAKAIRNESSFMLGVRGITNTTNERTIVSGIIPFTAVGNSLTLFNNIRDASKVSALLACLCSFALDFSARFKVGGINLNMFIIQQLPILPPSAFSSPDALHQRLGIPLQDLVLELVYTSYSMQPFALDCGYEGPPFIWDIERRFEIRCELDALFFHLYLGSQYDWERPLPSGTPGHLQYFPTPRHALEYIMESFPIVKRKDIRDFGEYRTQRRILEIYDEMSICLSQNKAYISPLQPAAGPPRAADGSYIPVAEWDEAEWPKNMHRIGD